MKLTYLGRVATGKALAGAPDGGSSRRSKRDWRIGGRWGRVQLNRSRRWAYAGSYGEARGLSPWPERPVR